MNSAYQQTPARIATASDIDAVVDVMTTAFFHDPLWGPAFPDERRRAGQAAVFWRLHVTSALRYPWLLVTSGAEAAAVWIPPGGTELTSQETSVMADLLTETTDLATAKAIVTICEQLEAVFPSEPCFYLSLLGTHDRHRGKGLGMGLLVESLARLDALGAPAYLESSNPANLQRYASVGFTPRDQVTTATGHTVTTMWRPAR
jgi:GNAT superfamily N-acetyltransferase